MSKKGQKKWNGYLQPSLDSLDKKQIKASALPPDELLSWLGELVEWGASASFALRGKEQSLALTVTFWNPNHRLDGYSISAWGVEPLQCLAVMHYYWSSGKYGHELEGLATDDDAHWW